MEKTARLILTDTYYDVFNRLSKEIEKNEGVLKQKTLVFCEEKISLMTERVICESLGGSFDVDVFSFGKFLRKKKNLTNVLGKEGSAMAVKRILGQKTLRCFSQSKQSLAPTVYELIMQLKSAKIYPDDILFDQLPDGVLKNKLLDIAEVYSGYEQFVLQNGFYDQSSVLDLVSDEICQDEKLKNSNVILLGYTSWTRQARDIVLQLINKAKSVTAILTAGDNLGIYLNETALAFRDICKIARVKLVEQRFQTAMPLENSVIKQNLFTPYAFNANRVTTDKVYLRTADSVDDEVLWVAQTIKSLIVERKMRFCDCSVAVCDFAKYGDAIERAFTLLEIPFFIDQKRKTENHPLISLIVSYVDSFRKGLDRRELKAFYKNPLFTSDKALADEFENYLIKYNVNYSRINLPFTLCDGRDDLDKLEQFRKRLCSHFVRFDVRSMLESLCVEQKLVDLGETLKQLNEHELCAVNEQVYPAIISILDQMDLLLGDQSLTLNELKSVFLSGVGALELSIIPQYKDAVFVGGYREVALALSKNLFMVGLDSSAPAVKEDIALLSDGDINKLERIKVMVEPKIKVVNERVKENAGLATLSFVDKLYLSYTAFTEGGKPNVKSEIISCLEKLFTVQRLGAYDEQEFAGYMTKGQALLSFADEVGKFADGRCDDVTKATSFYSLYNEDSTVQSILDNAFKQLKVRLSCEDRSVIRKVVSPTTIEDYYHCPYRAFASHTLKIRPREEGVVNPLAVGNLMHAIFERLVLKIDQITDETFESIFDECLQAVLLDDGYKKFTLEKDTAYALNSAINEAKRFCHKMYLQFKKSSFKPYKVEAVFGVGEDADFPPIKLTEKVKLTGKIDRLDSYKGYYRVIDYKTGSADATDKSLFAGLKLQLYLYADVVKDKTLAGVYYLPVDEKFKAEDKPLSPLAIGKTLDNEETVFAQDSDLMVTGESGFLDVTVSKGKIKKAVSQEALSAYADYAKTVAKKAAEQMVDGVIVASPYEGVCDYCKFKGICGGASTFERKVRSVNEQTIQNAVKGEA